MSAVARNALIFRTSLRSALVSGRIFVINAIPYRRRSRADVAGQYKDLLALVSAEVIERHAKLSDSLGERGRGSD
jgi:hypothetical protein